MEKIRSGKDIFRTPIKFRAIEVRPASTCGTFGIMKDISEASQCSSSAGDWP